MAASELVVSPAKFPDLFPADGCDARRRLIRNIVGVRRGQHRRQPPGHPPSGGTPQAPPRPAMRHTCHEPIQIVTNRCTSSDRAVSRVRL
ncbi:unnamed protein product, partial [Iphiclides podalirius]